MIDPFELGDMENDERKCEKHDRESDKNTLNNDFKHSNLKDNENNEILSIGDEKKLKTLKDLGVYLAEYTLEHAVECGMELKIRAEAIKWIKFYRKQNHGAQIPELLGENPKVQALIDFHNITEDDLK